MIEKAKALEMNENGFSKLIHGHTKIVLTSVKDGRKRVIEHDNTFQSDVLSKQLRSFGQYNNLPWANGTWASQSLWRNLVGGIFLFRDAIDLSGGDVEYMPAGNKMIGNGAYNVTNNAAPVELGSYNAIESSVGSGSLTLVFDWGTSQGNGTIGCVCLTSESGGKIGYGNASGGSLGAKTDLLANQESNAVNGFLYKDSCYRFAVDDSAKTLTVTKRPIAATKASIFNNINQSPSVLTYTNALGIGGGGITVMYMGNGKALICGTTASAANNASLKMLVYDFEANTVSEKSITNTTGSTVQIGSNNRRQACANGGHLFVPTSNAATNIFEIDIDTSAVIHEYTRATGTYNRLCVLSDGILLIDSHIIDTVNQTVYISNGVGDLFEYVDDYDAFVQRSIVESTADNNNARSVFKNPLYLATVNNLDTAVVKDNTQTMKVIYTLTEA